MVDIDLGFQVIQPTNVNRKVYPRTNLGDGSVGIQCVRFDPQDRYLAAGCDDGTIKIFNTVTGKLIFNLNTRMQNSQGVDEEEKMPTTCIRWRPAATSARTKNVLISVHADGSVQHWHTTSGKCLHRQYSLVNHLYCVDFNRDGTHFATAGRDLIVRVYDEVTKQCIVEFESGGSGAPGHSNRIFACKFYYDDPNILCSGGWDNTVQIWDMRQGCAVRAVFGPHICGDALDIRNGEILTGSWRETDQLQNFYLSTGECFSTIDWDGGVGLRRGQDACMVYAAQYSKHDNGGMILSGGSKSNEARLFDTTNWNKPFAAILDLPKPVFSVDFANSGNMAALGCADGVIRMIDIRNPDSYQAYYTILANGIWVFVYCFVVIVLHNCRQQ